MTQTLVPDSDISGDMSIYGGESTYWESIDTYLLTTYIYADAQLETATVGLSNVTDPQVGTGHTVYWTWDAVRDKTPPERGYVNLLQGATPIATCASDEVLPLTPTDGSYTLTEAEANSITDYTDLRLRFTASTLGASEQMRVYYAKMEVPDVPAPGETSNLMLLGVG